MAKKVSELTELITPPHSEDYFHIVDKSNIEDSPQGTSVFQKVSTFLRGRVFGKNTTVINTAANTLIFNMSNSNNHPGIQALQNDFVVFMDATDTRIIIGVAIDTCVNFPTDLDDITKFVKFHEGNKLIP